MEIRDEIEASFGNGPPLRPVTDAITAGRAALRRRRLGAGAAALGVAVVVGGTAYAATGGGTPSSEDGDRIVATDPTNATPAPPPPTGTGPPPIDRASVDFLGEPAAYDDHGRLVLAPGWTEVDRVPNPMHYTQDGYTSHGLEVTKDGQRRFVLLALLGSGSSVQSTIAEGTLRDWLVGATATQHTLDLANGDAPPAVGATEGQRWVELAPDGTLRALDGGRILDQVANPDLPAEFAPPGTPTAAAKVRTAEGDTVFVLVRRLGDAGGDDVVGTTALDATATLAVFLDYARAQLEGGGGLR